MIETEQSKKISDEQLAIDIENTREEAKAYEYLRDGYSILANLPETNQTDKSMYHFRSQANSQLAGDCYKFLEKLLALYRERKGIKE